MRRAFRQKESSDHSLWGVENTYVVSVFSFGCQGFRIGSISWVRKSQCDILRGKLGYMFDEEQLPSIRK